MGTNEIKIETGSRREFSTGAESQASSGKGTPVLVPGDAIIDIAKHFEKGAELYGPRNWEKGIPLSEQLNSLERHLQQEKMGMTDEPHARALAWRAIVYLDTTLRIEKGMLPAELDDMPTYTTLEERLDKEEIGVTDKVAEELEEMKAITDMNNPDYIWYCSGPNCCEEGKANSGDECYYCPKHKKGD